MVLSTLEIFTVLQYGDPAAPRVTVGEAGIEPGTSASELQSTAVPTVCMSHHISGATREAIMKCPIRSINDVKN